MFETLTTTLNQNSEFLTGVVAFVSGVCLLYLVMARTLKKRQEEPGDTSES